MFFQILSHAGLQINGSGKTLIFDPWLIGSTYWRSWWNYPPVSKELVDSLRPDFIYLTHIHWDHFQGTSLRKFSRETPILVPRGNVLRMKRDLNQIGFKNVIEIKHGETVELAPGFNLTSYQFYPFTDSAAVIECEGKVLLNSNDAKFMGWPLEQILNRYPHIDFVFRSHSSANPRLCYDFIDAPDEKADHNENYLRDFAAFVVRTGTRYAVPFASNHCFLHKEVFHLNETVTTPVKVLEYFQKHGIQTPEVKVMVSGDYWSSETGFHIADNPYFLDRKSHLEAYRLAKAPVLEKFYALEAKTVVTLAQVERYFLKFMRALPYPARWLFKEKPITYVLSGTKIFCFQIDLFAETVREINFFEVNDVSAPLQIHTSAYILRQCMALDLFLHLGISKRVRFRARKSDAKYLWLLELYFNLFESEMFPLQRLSSPRFILTWLPRWREIALYSWILVRRAVGKPFDMTFYLQPKRST
jgi:UDP-MurNAc hydroxylase